MGIVVRTHTEKFSESPKDTTATEPHHVVCSFLPRISIIEDLTKEPIPAGTNILVEYDPGSHWYAASHTIAAGWLKSGGERVSITAIAQPPETIRLQLKKLGLDCEELEKADRLRIHDYYTATLGLKSTERFGYSSLKAAEVSIDFVKTQLTGPPIPEVLRIVDSASPMSRFNEEKSWVEFLLTRGLPVARLTKSSLIGGMIRGIHSDWVYKQLEDANDAIIDMKLDESGEEPKNLIRIRSMRNIGFDARWHLLKMTENQVTLE